MGMLRIGLLLALVALLAGCHTIRFDVSDGPHERVVQQRKSFWFYSLFPDLEVDVSQVCPAGVVAVEEATTFSDGFFRLITLAIWTPRTSWYYCRPEGGMP